MHNKFPTISKLLLVVGLCFLTACDERTIKVTGLDDCIIQVNLIIEQNGRTHSLAAMVKKDRSVTTTGLGWIDWTLPFNITVRILQAKDTAECKEKGLKRGTNWIPLTPADLSNKIQVVIDGSNIGLASIETSTAPEACSLKAEFRDGRKQDTHNKQAHSDFSQIGAAPNLIDFTPTAGGTPNNKLGYTRGIYRQLNPLNILGWGYYKKLEYHVKVSKTCVITEMKRQKQTLPGHNFTAAQGITDDAIDPNRSMHKPSPQHWFFTDAPGMAVGNIGGANNKTFYRRYTVTTKGHDGNPANEWTHVKSFDVWIGINGQDKFKTPPPGHKF
jgi:hypothetical protein